DRRTRAIAYRTLFQTALDEELIAAIRTHLQQQKALGCDQFRAWVEARTGVFAGVGPPGRPPAEMVPGTVGTAGRCAAWPTNCAFDGMHHVNGTGSAFQVTQARREAGAGELADVGVDQLSVGIEEQRGWQTARPGDPRHIRVRVEQHVAQVLETVGEES